MDPIFLSTTPEQINAEYWAYHYEDTTASVEFDDDDEGAAEDYLAQITREAEEHELNGTAPVAPAVAPVVPESTEPIDESGVNDWTEETI